MLAAMWLSMALAAPVLEHGAGLHSDLMLDERDLSVSLVGHEVTYEQVGWPSETSGFGWSLGLGGGLAWDPRSSERWPELSAQAQVRFGAPQPRLRPFATTGVRARWLVGLVVVGSMVASGGVEIPVGRAVTALGLHAEGGSRGNISIYGGGLDVQVRWR